VAKLKYMETAVTDLKCIQKEIKGRLNMRNACYHSAQNLLPSQQQSKNLKLKIHITIVLLIVHMRVKLGTLSNGKNIN
jgi:hypothetical protein